MNAVDFYVNFFITLFALLDPIGNVPIFAAATRTQTRISRSWLVVYISIFSALFLSFFFFTGLTVLKFFGISMDAFRIAGGALLFLLGLDMTRGDFLAMFDEADSVGKPEEEASFQGLTNQGRARKSFEKLVVPFTIPLLIGPGAISTVIIQAGQAAKIGYEGFIAGILAIFTTSVALFVSFMFAEPISKMFGRIGMVVVIRVLGLVLCALAVQIIISSLGEITHNLILPSAAHPYSLNHR
jgi:multiple antibiotic resistance protein